MANGSIWELPFGSPAELELHSEWASISLLPVEAERAPRLQLSHGSAEHIDVHVERHGNVVRVALDPHRSFGFFGGWECRATLYVPRDVRAHVQTSAGSVSVRDLEDCELGIKANAGKVELEHVHGVLHLGADAGSVSGRDVGGYLDVETQAGSVRLEVTDLGPGDHRVRAAMGSVRMELARGLNVCIETRTSLDSVRNSYPSQASSPARLLVATEMGSVRIEEGLRGAHARSTAAANNPPAPPSAD